MNAHICHISPQARTCLFHNKSMKQQNCMCGRSKKSLLWCGIAIWVMKASMQRQSSTARSTFILPNVSFKLIAFVLPVWKTKYPQSTCSQGLPIISFMFESMSVFKKVSVWDTRLYVCPVPICFRSLCEQVTQVLLIRCPQSRAEAAEGFWSSLG